jgi:hypothetical protein
MAWPDEVDIGIACLIVAVALYGLFVLLNGLPPSAPFEVPDWTRFGVGLIRILFFVALPIWLAARLFDFVIGGPTKRKQTEDSPLRFVWRLGH